MKHLNLFCALVAFAVIGLGTACTPKHEPKADKVKTAFAQASDELKTVTTAATAAVKAKNYEVAVDELAKLEGKELTPEQKQAVADLLIDIQNSLTDQKASSELLDKVQNLAMSFM